MEKKSQAAIEFLVTYGWAILAVMVVIGALAYFGVFNTKRYINDECLFGNQLFCEDFVINSDNPKLNITLRNNYDVNIAINTFNITTKYASGPQKCIPIGFPPIYYSPGTQIKYSCTLTSSVLTIPLDERVDSRILVIYSRHGSTITHNLTGKIRSTVAVK